MNRAARPTPILLTVREMNYGGIERDVTQIALRIDRTRFEPHVASYKAEGIRFQELRDAGIPFLQMKLTSIKSLSAISAAMRVRRYIREHEIQLVHAYDSTAVFIAPLARALRVPAVLSSTLGSRELLDQRTHRQVRWTDKMVDAIVVNCEAMRRHLMDDEHIPGERIQLCYNGVDISRFHPERVDDNRSYSNGPFVIGAVCVLRPEKNLMLLQESFARIRHLKPGMKLRIVGSGPELSKLEENSSRLGLKQDCEFLPATQAMPEVLRTFDIYVSCSSSEAFSNTILEAMACGRSVVGSRVGGTPELIGEDERGLLFTPGDPADLASKLAKLVGMETLRCEIGRRAAEFAKKNLSIEIASERMAEIYETVLQRKIAS